MMDLYYQTPPPWNPQWDDDPVAPEGLTLESTLPAFFLCFPVL